MQKSIQTSKHDVHREMVKGKHPIVGMLLVTLMTLAVPVIFMVIIIQVPDQYKASLISPGVLLTAVSSIIPQLRK